MELKTKATLMSDVARPSKDVLSELRILHEEICSSDGGECEMMVLVRRGADEVELLRNQRDSNLAKEVEQTERLKAELQCVYALVTHWSSEAKRLANAPETRACAECKRLATEHDSALRVDGRQDLLSHVSGFGPPKCSEHALKA
jgi:hypothetical protein